MSYRTAMLKAKLGIARRQVLSVETLTIDHLKQLGQCKDRNKDKETGESKNKKVSLSLAIEIDKCDALIEHCEDVRMRLLAMEREVDKINKKIPRV